MSQEKKFPSPERDTFFGEMQEKKNKKRRISLTLQQQKQENIKENIKDMKKDGVKMKVTPPENFPKNIPKRIITRKTYNIEKQR